MDYNHNVAMSNIVNIFAALNQGGMLSVRDITNRIIEDTPEDVVFDKIRAARLPENRTVQYMANQLRGEIRRSLNTYFANCEHIRIDRATAHNDVERFWVVEPQEYVDRVRIEGPPGTLTVSLDLDGDTLNMTAPSSVMEVIEARSRVALSEFIGQEDTPENRRLMGERVDAVIDELMVGAYNV